MQQAGSLDMGLLSRRQGEQAGLGRLGGGAADKQIWLGAARTEPIFSLARAELNFSSSFSSRTTEDLTTPAQFFCQPVSPPRPSPPRPQPHRVFEERKYQKPAIMCNLLLPKG